MKKLKFDLDSRFLKLLNVCLVTLPFAVSWHFFYEPLTTYGDSILNSFGIVLIYLVLYVIFTRVYEAFLVSLSRISEMIGSQIISGLIADGIIYMVICLVLNRIANILPGLAVVCVQFLVIVCWCVCVHRWYFRKFPPKKTAVIYEERDSFSELVDDYSLKKKFDILKTMHVSECLEQIDALKGMEAVFLSGLKSEDRNQILSYCVDNYIHVYLIPEVGDLIVGGGARMHLFHLPMIRTGHADPGLEYMLLKRLFDLILSLAALILTGPIMLVTALCIHLYDRGPVFYRQKRLTKDGKVFWVIKFRSMRVNAEANGKAVLSTGDADPRITPVGRVIRKYRIDELPQLFNILGGSMSIVGPRPERPEIAAEYEKVLPEFRLRLQTKAGLTGYAQVYGKYNTTPLDKLKLDLTYLANQSFLMDLMICFATVKILFISESTEGIAVGQTNALAQRKEVP